uniref:uncharacterized protein LOC122608529 isoform X2 n=1 Tax=Erigeron canadensis TaxID=72917 RepID=UPI001CB994E0|nr:uncharacterized protein LOC122608529 isoform X2 [Erigeron canadensis]
MFEDYYIQMQVINRSHTLLIKSVQNGSHKNPVCKILRLLYLPRLNRHVASPGDSPKIDGIHLHNLRMCWSTPPTSHVDMWKWQCFYTNRLLKHTHT